MTLDFCIVSNNVAEVEAPAVFDGLWRKYLLVMCKHLLSVICQASFKYMPQI